MLTAISMLRLSRRPGAVSVLGLILMAALTLPALADHRYRDIGVAQGLGHFTADGNLVDVQIRVEGSTAPLYFRPGRWDRHYFQAYKGRNYALVVRNNTGRRVGVLIAVDGLNVVNGERSRLSHDEPMYVLDPREEAVIRGWRTSLDEVRRFVFVDEDRSYAERTGQANGDMGWIRVLSFREVEPIAWWDRWGHRTHTWSDDRDQASRSREESKSAAPAPGAKGEARADEAAPAPLGKEEARDGSPARPTPESLRSGPPERESNPGTGWGDRRHDRVERTEFASESQPSDRIVLRYEYANGLRALGIFPRRPRIWDREGGQLGFAQPPRW